MTPGTDAATTDRTTTDAITGWLLLVGALAFVMVLIGGFVRLSRAGLSIVEWDAVTGVVPPIGEDAWQESFAAYQQTPEYQLVNQGMSLDAYQRIYYIEWAHRLLARVAGLLVVLPLIWFVWRRRLSLRASLPYWGIAALFAIQGAIGWAMVSSGLRDRPAVSHFRLTIHLLTALALLAIVLWMARSRMSRTDRLAGERRGGRWLAWGLLAAVVVQIAYGGLVAGLKAGHVSDTWPLMYGTFLPAGVFPTQDPWWSGLFEALEAHWVHRWFAFIVAALAISVAVELRRVPALRAAGRWLIVVVLAQISLGVGVVLFGVRKWLALAHQGLGVVVFVVALIIVHDLRGRSPVGAPVE